MSKEKQEFETILASYSEYSQTINQAILEARSELTLSCTILANDADTDIRELKTQKGSVIFFFSKKDGRWEALHKMNPSEDEPSPQGTLNQMGTSRDSLSWHVPNRRKEH